MKRSIFMLVALALFASCEEMSQEGLQAATPDVEDDVTPPDSLSQGATLTFTSVINEPTRVTDSAFDANDSISVAAFADNDTTLVADAVTYISNGTYFSSSSPIVYATQGVTYSFYAVYPVLGELESGVSFYAKADQGEDGAYAASDMLFASISSSDATPQLTFDHVMSSIVLNITGDGNDSGTMALYAKLGMGYDIFSGSTGAEGDTTTITPASNGTASYKVIVAPQTIAANTSLAKFSVGEIVHEWTLDEDFVLESGKQYTFDWSLADRSVTLKGEINGWDGITGDTIYSK